MAALALTAVAALIRFWHLGHQSFWYDESFTALLVHHSLGGMLALLPRTELTPPLYYLAVWAWAHVFGSGEAGLRSLSALAGIGTVPVLYLAAARLSTRRVGLVTATLAACNPLLIWYSQEARSYALLLLFSAMSLLAFAYAQEPHSGWRRLIAWGLACTLVLATHYYGALAVAPQAAWLLWVHRADRRLLAVLGALVVVEAALVPLALSQGTKATWIALWSLGGRLSQVAPQFLLGTGAPARTVLKLIGALALGVTVFVLVRRADRSERRLAVLCAGLAASPIALALVLVAAGSDELITRNVIVALLPLLIGIACGLGAKRAGALGWLGVIALCAVGLTAASAVALDASLQRPNWRALVRVIEADGRQPGGRALLLENYGSLMPLAIDLPGLQSIRRSGAIATELDVVAMHGAPGWFCWWGSTCNLRASAVHPSFALPGLKRDGGIVHVASFWVMRLRASAPVRITPARVRGAARRSRLYPRYALLLAPAG
jgi:4-amino-4-deoxy-L-arabinose transferase-like glycosyltransferase